MSETQSGRFYFDVLSPYAYIAWVRARRSGLMDQLEPTPVLFAALLKHHGTLGPAEIPAKRRWLWGNVLRKCRRYQIDIKRPAFHPFNPLGALRACCAAQIKRSPDTPALIDALFSALWVRRLHVAEGDVLKSVVSKSGHDPELLNDSDLAGQAKHRLRANTEQAIADGVFGVPSFVVNGEVYWGEDEIDDVTAAVSGQLPPFDPGDLQPVSASAERPR